VDNCSEEKKIQGGVSHVTHCSVVIQPSRNMRGTELQHRFVTAKCSCCMDGTALIQTNTTFRY
jgi:hypothetical protein